MFRKGLQLSPQFSVSQPNDFSGATSTRTTFGSVGLTSSVNNTPESEQPESFITKLLAAPGSESKSELVNRYFAVKYDIEAHLQETRTARLEILIGQHDAAVKAARAAGRLVEQAESAEWAAHELSAPLDEAEAQARKALAGAQHKAATSNRALMTRKEVAAFGNHINKLSADLKLASEVAGKALLAYHALLAKSGEARRAHLAAVNEAEALSAQIDSL
jgi:hypothetical protein